VATASAVVAVVVPVASVVTARVVTAAAMLVRRLRALPLASSSLSSVVASGEAVALPLLKQLTFA
jgi:hypothetical protein